MLLRIVLIWLSLLPSGVFFFFFLLLCFLSIILVFAWALGNANRSFLGQQLFRVCQLD